MTTVTCYNGKYACFSILSSLGFNYYLHNCVVKLGSLASTSHIHVNAADGKISRQTRNISLAGPNTAARKLSVYNEFITGGI